MTACFIRLLPYVSPFTALKFLGVLKDVCRTPFADAREEVEYYADDVFGEGCAEYRSVRFETSSENAANARTLGLPFRTMRVMRMSSSIQRSLVS